MLLVGGKIMTYGLIFYWCSWLFWGIITFFMKKGTLRTALSLLILMSILFSNFNFSIGGYVIFLPFLFLVTVSLFLYARLPKTLYQFFCSFILMIGYTAILFWEYSTTIYLFVSDIFLLPIICCILINLVVKGLYSRIIISMFGTAGGEILHGLIMESYHLPKIIGSQDFFVILYIVLLFQLLLHIYKKAKANFYTFVISYLKS